MYASVRLTLSFLTPAERIKYFLLVAGRALTGLLDVFGIVLIGVVASIGASQLSPDENDSPPIILGIQVPSTTGPELVGLVLIILLVFVLKALLATGITRVLTLFIAGLEVENAGRIANLLLRGSLQQAKRYSKAEFQYAITASTTYAFTGILNFVAVLVSEGFLLIIISATFFLVDPVVAIVALLYFGLIIVVIQLVIGRSLKHAGVDAVEGTVETTNAISDTMDTFREISVLAKQDLFLRRINISRRRVAKSGAVITFLAGMPRYVVETALILGVVGFVAQQFITGQLAEGIVTIGVFLTGGVRIMASLLPLQNAIAQIKQNVEQAKLAQGLIQEARKFEVSESSQPDPVRVAAPISADRGLPLSIEGVSFHYPGDEHDTLHDISFHVDGGQHVAIVGPSGAGKTTLVDLILGLVSPDSGEIWVDGVHPRSLRVIAPGSVAYVPQKPGLVSGTILENIALGVPPEEIDRERVRDAVESAYLGAFIDSLPAGLDTSVGKQVDSLSGGQIQRLGLARALYTQPRLLVLDEATSGLDAGSEAFVSESLRKLYGRVTVIVIAHRLSTVQHSDVVHVLEDGRVVASGDFPTVRATVPMVAEYVKLMSFDAS